MNTFQKLCLVFLGACWLGCGPASADKRVALVIGNGAYAYKAGLPNPPHDAADVAAALKRSDFEVISGIDMSQSGMQDAAIRFSRAARNADVALFYYSGHAMQFNGVNYLMPIDAKLDDEADLKRFTRVDDIMNDLQQAKNLKILVLDSCRDNPLAETLKRSIGQTRGVLVRQGLSKMEAPLGTIVSFSTQAGQTADDGNGRNSPYTAAFLKRIEEPHEIGDIFRQIGSDVYETSGKAQLPELSLSIVGKLYLNGPVSINIAASPPAAPVDRCASAEAHWKAADSIGTMAAYEDHVSRFPACSFSSLAKARIDGLKQKTARAMPADSPSAAASGTGSFDGTWDVTVTCADQGSVRGYTRYLTAVVTDGVLRAEDQSTGKPNWLMMQGEIAKDGKAKLNVRGLTGDAKYSVGQIKTGSEYRYTVDAQFEANRGAGKRNELRSCNLTFARK
ncbi:MAG: caspase family protein [Bradyrhizobium sp.]